MPIKILIGQTWHPAREDHVYAMHDFLDRDTLPNEAVRYYSDKRGEGKQDRQRDRDRSFWLVKCDPSKFPDCQAEDVLLRTSDRQVLLMRRCPYGTKHCPAPPPTASIPIEKTAIMPSPPRPTFEYPRSHLQSPLYSPLRNTREVTTTKPRCFFTFLNQIFDD